MVSQIDPTVPVFGAPTTQSVRNNFLTAANEISALQQETQYAPFLPLSGGRMGGPMYLFNDPTDAMMPATKGYVDAGGGAGGGGIPEAPADDQYYGRFDGSWQPVLSMKGGTLIGKLILAGDATDALGAATKEQLDAVAATVLADAPNDANIYGRHANAWSPVLPISGGQVTGSFGVGVAIPTSPAPSAPTLFVQNAVAAKYLTLNAYSTSATDATWAYAATGFAARFIQDTVTGVFYLNIAPSGNSGAAVTFNNPFNWDLRGCFYTAGVGSIPTDCSVPLIAATRFSVTPTGTYNFNLYNTASGFKALVAGYSGWTGVDANGWWYVNLFPSSAAGGIASTPSAQMYLTQSGVLNVPYVNVNQITPQQILNIGGLTSFNLYNSGGFPTLNFAPYNYIQLGGGNTIAIQCQGQINLAPGGNIINCNAATVSCGGVSSNGNIVAGGNNSVVPSTNNQGGVGVPGLAWFQCASYNFVQQSDPLDKRDLQDAPSGALRKVRALAVKTYRHKEDKDDAPLRLGFDASDVARVHPDAVRTDKNGNSPGYSLSDMNALLWQAVQELASHITGTA